MLSYRPEISILLLIIEFFAALTGVIYFSRLRQSYWKWFSTYLVFIFLQEAIFFFHESFLGLAKHLYYTYIGIPLQWLFLYWLYALKSLRKKWLFKICILIYATTYIPIQISQNQVDILYSFSLIICTLLLSGLILLEFIKQIRNDDIVNIKENKMFYINIGVILFYIGAFPIHGFNKVFYEEYFSIWEGYFIYFKLSNCVMYLLFICSFIWGKVSLSSR